MGWDDSLHGYPRQNPSADQHLSTSIPRVSHSVGGTLVLLLPQEIVRRSRIDRRSMVCWDQVVEEGEEGGHDMGAIRTYREKS